MAVTMSTATTPAELRAKFLTDLRAALEPQAAGELRERRERAEGAAMLAESGLETAREQYAPLAGRLAVLESRIADAQTEIGPPDIEKCSNAEWFDLRFKETQRRMVLPVLRQRHSEIANACTPLVQNIRQAEAALKAEKNALADLDAAIADPFGTDLGLDTEAGLTWRSYVGLGTPVPEPAPAAPADRRIRKRKDGTVLAIVNPREIPPEQAAHVPSAHPLWQTTSAPAGGASDPGRIPGEWEMRPGVPGAGR
jgi:hypothetical protein